MMPSCTDRRGRQRERRDEIPSPRGVARIDDNRKVGELLENGNGG